MKKRQVDRVERRRQLVEINLIAGETKGGRSAARRQGCASLIARLSGGAVIALGAIFVLA